MKWFSKQRKDLKKPLSGRRCYLSGPIEQQDPDALNWRTEPLRRLSEEFELDMFDPFSDPKQARWEEIVKAKADKNYEELREIARDFVRKDLGKVDRSDILIAYCPYKVPTTGTTHEVINANDRKKPTLLVCPEGKINVPLWYYGFVPLEFMFSSWEELYSYLHEVNAGLHIDQYRWSFVYGLI